MSTPLFGNPFDDLDTAPPSMQAETPTAVAAAQAAAPTLAPRRRELLEYIASRGADGATAEEMQDALKMKQTSVTPRLYELAGGYAKLPWQFVKDSGRVRKQRNGLLAKVWVVVDPPVPVDPSNWCPVCGRKFRARSTP